MITPVVQSLQLRRKPLKLMRIRSDGQFLRAVDIRVEAFHLSHRNHLINSAVKRRHHGLDLLGCTAA